MKRLLIAALATASLGGGLAACTTPTDFGPAAPYARASGFWDMRIEPGRFRVSYRGGSGAPPALVQDYTLLHAADLTVAEGYDWFRVVGRYGEVQGPAVSSSLSVGGASFGRHSAVGLGFGIPLGDTGPQLTDTFEIILGKGARPEGVNVYGAREVQASIRPRLPMPMGPRVPPPPPTQPRSAV
jgi:hypothetical protein